MGETGTGVMELISDFPDGMAEFDRLRHMVERSGRPLTVSLAQTGSSDSYRGMLPCWSWRTGTACRSRRRSPPARSVPCSGSRPRSAPSSSNPEYLRLSGLPFEERLEALLDPRRASGCSPLRQGGTPGRFDALWELGDPPDYEQPADRTIGARAHAAGRGPAELAYEAMVADGGRGFLYFPFANYVDHDFEAILEMLRHPLTLVGLGDGGAHVGTICDGSNVTSMLTHWVRDRTRGERIELPWAVHALTRRNAEAVGMLDRGLVAPGYKADLNVIDLDRLRLHPPEMRFDLPAGGKRLLQRVDGYRTTIVSGQVTYRDGEPTGALPGRLVRGAQPEPTAP